MQRIELPIDLDLVDEGIDPALELEGVETDRHGIGLAAPEASQIAVEKSAPSLMIVEWPVRSTVSAISSPIEVRAFLRISI
jgi:hypothetical protein